MAGASEMRTVADPEPCAIAVMAKASAPGLTKTRLSPPLSPEEAADLNTRFLQDIADNIDRAAQTTPIAAYMAFGPPGSEPFFKTHLPPGVGLIETWLGDFGDCLVFALEALLARGHASACVLNSDSPTLPAAILVSLAEALAAPGDRVVIGPADDGGYYVLGLKTVHRRLFEDIAWSTERVLDQTLARAAEIGLPVHLLPSWYDVDDAEGLRRLQRDVFASASSSPAPSSPASSSPAAPSPAALGPTALGPDSLRPSPAEHTRALLTEMIENGRLDARLRAHGRRSA